VLPGFVVVVGGKRRRGRPMSYWKTTPEFQRDLEKKDVELTAKLGRQPSATERAKALSISRDTLYTWLKKVEEYEHAQGTHLRAVGE
jgi:DNA invertase Pin-like site-specific DNA recombinase